MIKKRGRPRKYPKLSKIKNGWAALGPGWGVHGATPDEALARYAAAEAKHREIDQRPFWYEQVAEGATGDDPSPPQK
jgi:hypothetical protein